MLNTLVAMGIKTIINTNMKYALPEVDDIYYITENNEVCENVPTEDCFASVIKQGDNVVVILNDVGEVVDVFKGGKK